MVGERPDVTSGDQAQILLDVLGCASRKQFFESSHLALFGCHVQWCFTSRSRSETIIA